MFEQDYVSPWSNEKVFLLLREQPKLRIWSFEKFKGFRWMMPRIWRILMMNHLHLIFYAIWYIHHYEGDNMHKLWKTIRSMGMNAFKKTMKGEESKSSKSCGFAQRNKRMRDIILWKGRCKDCSSRKIFCKTLSKIWKENEKWGWEINKERT